MIRRAMVLVVGLMVWLPTACVPSSTEPVLKIGLIAPFEGLYRRTGYEALAAMRLALQDAQSAAPMEIALAPLALDDANVPERSMRAAQKLLVDPSVRAVVGPLTPQTGVAAGDVLDASAVAWFLPHAAHFAGEASQLAGQITGQSLVHDSEQWMEDLVVVVASTARSRGAERLILAGWSPGWPQHDAETWRTVLKMPVLLSAEPGVVTATDAVLWLGDASEGAAYLRQLRAENEDAPFWLGPAGADPVFVDHADALSNVFWVTWLDGAYDAWREETGMSTTAYLVYRATQWAARAAQVAQGVETAASMIDEPTEWRVYVWEFSADGTSSPLLNVVP